MRTPVGMPAEAPPTQHLCQLTAVCDTTKPCEGAFHKVQRHKVLRTTSAGFATPGRAATGRNGPPARTSAAALRRRWSRRCWSRRRARPAAPARTARRAPSVRRGGRPRLRAGREPYRNAMPPEFMVLLSHQAPSRIVLPPQLAGSMHLFHHCAVMWTCWQDQGQRQRCVFQRASLTMDCREHTVASSACSLALHVRLQNPPEPAWKS